MIHLELFFFGESSIHRADGNSGPLYVRAYGKPKGAIPCYFHRMKTWIVTVVLTLGAPLIGQTYAGLGFGVSSGAGLYAEHFIHPKWSLEANAGVPAAGFGVNYVLSNPKSKQLGIAYTPKQLERRSSRLMIGLTITAAILPDVGLFQYRFWNVGLHQVVRKTDFGMELGWICGAIVAGPSGSFYPQYFSTPGVQFTIGRALFVPGPLQRLKKRVGKD